MIETNFKNTEIGRIPQEWEVDKLIDKFEFRSNNTFSRDALSESGTIQDVHYGDVLIKYGSHLDVQKDEIPYITDKNYRTSVYISDGDVIMADTAEDETVGKATEVINVGHHQLVSGLHTMWLHPKVQERYALGYLGYAFNANIFHNQLLPLMQGTKVTSISKTAIKDTYILIPPKSEQTRIATALSNVDALISELGRLIEKKRAIKQGAMQQLLTGKKRLNGFNEPWGEKKLGEILQYEQPTKYLVSSTEYSDNGVPVLTAGKTFILGYTNEPNGIYNNLPVIIFDDFVTESKYVDFPFKAKSSAMKMLTLRNEENNLRFIFEIMQMIDFPMTDHKRWWIGEYSNIVVKVPTLAEQSAIASVLTSMDDEITALEAKKAKYEQIKQGMMQQLLTGRIRLV